MDKLKEIFKNKPELLHTEEVKNLINYFQSEYNILIDKNKRLFEFECFVLDRCMNSNVVVKQGNDCSLTVNQILEYIEKTNEINP